MKTYTVTYIDKLINLPFKKYYAHYAEIKIEAEDKLDCIKKAKSMGITVEKIKGN